MILYIRLILLFLLGIHCNETAAQIIDIGLYNQSLLKSSVIAVQNGQYELTDSNSFAITVTKEEVIFFSLKNDSILVFSKERALGLCKNIYLIPNSDDCSISVKPLEPNLKRQLYDDGLKITTQWGVMQLMNQVDIDKYVSGVVEAEGGPRASEEYYKSQALLCRTYCIQNLNRHINDGFHLCDEVHCQAFNGRCSINTEIINATSETSGMILADTDTVLVLAAFYASCGGLTESAGNIWGSDKSYLKSIKDPYCIAQNNTNWTKTIGMDEWKYYLKNKGLISNNTNTSTIKGLECTTRCNNYSIENKKIPLTIIRSDFNLKSAFFSIKIDGKNVSFRGHGFGHGVGLCQEGAMEMSRKGKNYIEIINFYYRNVHTFEIGMLNPTKNPSIQLLK